MWFIRTVYQSIFTHTKISFQLTYETSQIIGLFCRQTVELVIIVYCMNFHNKNHILSFYNRRVGACLKKSPLATTHFHKQ